MCGNRFVFVTSTVLRYKFTFKRGSMFLALKKLLPITNKFKLFDASAEFGLPGMFATDLASTDHSSLRKALTDLRCFLENIILF